MGESLLYSKSSGGVNVLWGKVYSMTPGKTTDLSQVTDTLSHNVVSSTPRH